MGVSIKIERKKDEYLNKSKKKWLGVLIEERKLSKNEMCHLGWDKLKRKMYHHKWDGWNTFYFIVIIFLFIFWKYNFYILPPSHVTWVVFHFGLSQVTWVISAFFFAKNKTFNLTYFILSFTLLFVLYLTLFSHLLYLTH